MSSLRLGFDIGGTFTDFVLADPATGALRLHKRLTTPPKRCAISGWGKCVIASASEAIHLTVAKEEWIASSRCSSR